MQLETHEEQVFLEMGGLVIPPKRPGSRDKYSIMKPERDVFMMDFENSCLELQCFKRMKQHPTGNKRHEHPEWAAMIQSQVYPNHSDVDWHEYVDWVSRGFGDKWFQEEGDVTP